VTASYSGNLSLGQAVPLTVTAEARIGAATGPALAKLNARLAGVIRAQAGITVTPPSAAGNLQAALDLVTALEASISLGAPSVDFQASALASARVSIEAAIAALSGLSLGFDLQSGGVHLYKYLGDNSSMAVEMRNVLNPGLPGAAPSDIVAGWFIAATSPAQRASLQIVLG
jgi:hypothetical protein